jgi:hypothetical protein
MSAINAKGYDMPVSIYSPIWANPVTSLLPRTNTMHTYKKSENFKKIEIENQNENENENSKKVQKNEKKIENEKIKNTVFLAPKPYVRCSDFLFFNENDNIESKLKRVESPVRGMYTGMYIYMCMYI